MLSTIILAQTIKSKKFSLSLSRNLEIYRVIKIKTRRQTKIFSSNFFFVINYKSDILTN